MATSQNIFPNFSPKSLKILLHYNTFELWVKYLERRTAGESLTALSTSIYAVRWLPAEMRGRREPRRSTQRRGRRRDAGGWRQTLSTSLVRFSNILWIENLGIPTTTLSSNNMRSLAPYRTPITGLRTHGHPRPSKHIVYNCGNVVNFKFHVSRSRLDPYM